MKRISLKIILIFILIVAAVCLLLHLIHISYSYAEKASNHSRAEEILSVDLAFSWDNMDEQLDTINDLLNNKPLYDKDAGRLYERAALIYLQKGDSVTYYKNLGYALYYLDGNDDDDTAINIYLDLANFYLNNYSFSDAEAMLNKAVAIKPIDEIENLQIKSYAYRIDGLMNFMRYNYNEAETAIMNSQRVLEQCEGEAFTESYIAMNDVWLARIYEETGRLSKCKEKLDKWEDSDMFTTEVYRTIFLRDFIIPYYQAKCYYLCAENIKEYNHSNSMDSEAKEQAVIDFLHEFMDLCEENNYEKAELYTILKVQREYPTRNEAIQKELNFVLNQLYVTLFDQQNTTLSSVVNDIVYGAINELQNSENQRTKSAKRSYLILFAWLVGLTIFTVLLIQISNSRYDNLTNLFNRNMFNYNLGRIKRSKANYGIIMIDIDDFKRVNDNYGHLNGDIVLWRLGQILLTELTTEIKPYRYGGEEFVITVERSGLPYLKAIAQRIRKHMEEQAWEFDKDLVITLSIGCAIGHNEDDVVKSADEKLYVSKINGKNQVTM